MSHARRFTFFATCAPGVEPVLHREASALRFAKIERQVGGVRFEGTIEDAWRAVFSLRTAVRVYLRLERFRAEDGDALYAGVGTIDWSRFVRPDGSLVVSAQTKDSKLDHTLFIEQRTKDAIVDQFARGGGVRPSVEKDAPDLFVHVHLWRNRATISVDTAGASLHKRGWRRYQGRAPLAETLAAAVVELSGWDGRAPLIDPFCGSGTLLIEAALSAFGVPPGVFRKEFGFERFPTHDAARWKALRAKWSEPAPARRPPILLGVDRDPKTIAGARRNVEAAGLGEIIELAVGEATAFEFKHGWNASIVTNPPYGERVDAREDLVGLYRRFGLALRARASGYRLALLSGNPDLSRALGLHPEKVTELLNGAIRCELLELTVP